jgi:hypothetical protein
MSEVVHYRGTLTRVEKLESESLEDQCKRLSGNKRLQSYHDSYQEQLVHDNYQDYVILDDVLYSVKKQDIDPDEDISRMTENEDGTLSFEVKYYNGGCSFDEAIEEAFGNKEVKL